MIYVQLCLYCLLFTATVRYSVRGGAINGLYFYPKAVQERAYEIVLTDRETVKKRSFLALIWLVGVLVVAGLVVLLEKVI